MRTSATHQTTTDIRCQGTYRGQLCNRLLVKSGLLFCPRCKKHIPLHFSSGQRCDRCKKLLHRDYTIQCGRCKHQNEIRSNKMNWFIYDGKIYVDCGEERHYETQKSWFHYSSQSSHCLHCHQDHWNPAGSYSYDTELQECLYESRYIIKCIRENSGEEIQGCSFPNCETSLISEDIMEECFGEGWVYKIAPGMLPSWCNRAKPSLQDQLTFKIGGKFFIKNFTDKEVKVVDFREGKNYEVIARIDPWELFFMNTEVQ